MTDRPRICVVGSINMDVVVRAPRFARPGETVLGGPVAMMPGGKGANQAVAAARMGAGVTLIGAVGEDAYGRELVGTLGAEGVDVALVSSRGGVATGVAVITVREETGENSIVVAPGANALVSLDDVRAARAVIRDADLLLVQLETPLETVIAAAELARELGTTVMLNAAPAPPRGLPPELLANVDILLVNETEAETIAAVLMAPLPLTSDAAEDGCGALLRRLAGTGVDVVVMTMGDRGAAYVQRQQAGRAAAFSVEPVDTVGAGDAFAGAFATRWAEHQAGGGLGELGLVDVVAWACAAGALATTKRGTMAAQPRRADVARLLRG
jgi:ribokinase